MQKSGQNKERRRTQEVHERVELERHRAEDEQRNRKEAKQRAELERQRAEAGGQAAESKGSRTKGGTGDMQV
jgi:hypothetical protein